MRQLIALRNFSSIPLAEVPALPADHPRSQKATRRRLARLHAALCPEQQRANANLCFERARTTQSGATLVKLCQFA